MTSTPFDVMNDASNIDAAAGSKQDSISRRIDENKLLDNYEDPCAVATVLWHLLCISKSLDDFETVLLWHRISGQRWGF